jgi:uncharacterized protein (DUF58 family)
VRYLDSVALAQLKNMRFNLRRHQAEGHLTGRHRSVKRGFSQEFAEHRAYAPGDEISTLDWKVYARTDRYFVKQFQEEKSLKTYVMLDRSGSMAYAADGRESKWERACRLGLSMAYLILSQGDAAGLVTFDDAPRDFVVPRRNLGHLELMDSTLAAQGPQGETDLGEVLLNTVNRMPRRSLIVLVSDLLGDYKRILETVRVFRARKHRVLVLQVLDPSERDLEMEGPVLFEDLEGRGDLRCEVSLIRAAYREEFARQQRMYEVSFRRTGVYFDTFYTDDRWDLGLARFLALQDAVG